MATYDTKVNRVDIEFESTALHNKFFRQYIHSLYPYINITQIDFSEIKKIDIDQCNEPTQTLESYYSTHTSSMSNYPKPDVLINGGLFYMKEGTPILTLYNEGKLINYESWLKTGMGVIGDSQLVYTSIENANRLNIRDFVTAYPMYIIDSKPVNITYATELKSRALRTIVAWNSTKLFLINVLSPGLTFDEVQSLLTSFEQDIGEVIEYAANLDGGGSVRKLILGETAVAIDTNRPVDNVFAIYLKDYKIGYRVQLGAFSSKYNAKRLLGYVQRMGQGIIDYSQAFIKYEDEYYRVQVGFFGSKENAQKVCDELNDAGYSTYIKDVKEEYE